MTTIKAKAEKISASLPADLIKWLKRRAATSRRSVSSLLTESLLREFNRSAAK